MRRVVSLPFWQTLLALACLTAVENSKGEDMLTLNFYSPSQGTLAGEVTATNWADFSMQSTWWPNARFFYTTDGTEPSSNSIAYMPAPGGPLLRITNSLTFRGVAYDSSFTQSNARTLRFNMVEGNREEILFSETRHQSTGVETVVVFMTSKFFPHRVFYTVDGSEPTTNSAGLAGYVTYVEVRTNATLRAKAYKEDLSQSVTGEWDVRLRSTFTVGIDGRRLADPALVVRDPSYDNYVSNAVVTVSAFDMNGWIFKGWASGESEETIFDTNHTLRLVVTNNVNLYPIFKTRITTNVVGAERIVAPAEAQFRETVPVQAVPAEGYYFAGWGGVLKGNTNETTSFEVSGAAPEITALFAPVGQQLVTLTVRTDAGQIRVTPERDLYAQGEVVKVELDLAELPSPVPTTNGSFGPKRFVGWRGDASGTENPLSVLMDRSKVIEALVEPAYAMEGLEVSLAYASQYPAVGEDGSVYISSAAKLYSLTPNLKVNWVVTNLWFAGEVAIGDSGNIYVASENGNAICVSPSGEVLWRYLSDDPYIYSPVDFWPRTVTITSDETLYYVSGRSFALAGSPHLYIVKDGKLVRRVDNALAVPLAGPDDTLYVATATGFEAHKPYGTVQWGSTYARPVAIDANGRLYSVSGGTSIVALDFAGRALWTRAVPAWISGVRIGEEGRVFVSTQNGPTTVFNTNGVVLWQVVARDALPTEDGGALTLESKSAAGSDPFFGPGTHLWTIFQRILPDGKKGEFSTYYSAFMTKRPFSVGQTVLSESGDAYGHNLSGSGDPYSNSRKSLFHWKGAIGRARSSWPTPLGLRNTGRAIAPESGSRVAVAQSGEGWVLRKRIAGEAVLEVSTNLTSWETMGEISGEIPIGTGAEGRRFYRLRMK